ncbi:MAG: RloB domain-containing protein [Lachnospiraceae bacterium]|nr:RloB domain-containing protein [Lachnospiraceae bacterium]
MKNRRLKTKDRGTKNRKKKAVYLIVTEGKNKTEKTYFANFIGRDKQYNIHFVNAGYNTDS